MDYLYFDTECCNGESLCSFGYVIVDCEFNIIEKKDILINPETEFKLGRAGFDPAINLAYSEEEFRKSPKFTDVYGEIKGLLEKEDRAFLGHSIDHDLKYLYNACVRYDKSEINVKAYDTQRIYNSVSYSLHKIMHELEIDISNFKEHNSRDDAEMSMLYIKAICERQNINIDELLNRKKDCLRVYKHSHKKSSKNKTKNNIIKLKMAEQLKKKGMSYKEYIKSLSS